MTSEESGDVGEHADINSHVVDHLGVALLDGNDDGAWHQGGGADRDRWEGVDDLIRSPGLSRDRIDE